MKKGVVLLISAIAFGGIITTGLASCAVQTEQNDDNNNNGNNNQTNDGIVGATIRFNNHGEFVVGSIVEPKESYKSGDVIKLGFACEEGYALEYATLNGVKIENTDNVTLVEGVNVIDVYAKITAVTEGTTNIRDFVFEEINGGTAYKITSYTPTGIYPKIAEFPETYLGKPVKEITYETKTTTDSDGNPDTIVTSRYLFGGLSGVKIPKTIEKIDTEVFRSNSSLESITVDEANTSFSSDGTVLLSKDKKTLIAFPQGVKGEYKVPDGVTTIGHDAFYGAIKLTSIDLNKVETIGANAFNSIKGIKEIVLPDTVKTLGEGAFSTAVEVEKITLSNQLTIIPENCFYKNSSLKEISIPASVTTIGKYAFYDCTDLTKFIMSEGLKTVDDNAVSHTLVEELNFPTTLETIGKAAFGGNDKLKTVTLKEGVTKIGESAFYRNLKLSSINIPASVNDIGKSAFGLALSLEKFVVDSGNKNYKTIDGVLFDINGEKLISYPSAKKENIENYTYKIPSGTKELDYQCFAGVSNNPEGESSQKYSIRTIFMPKSVVKMDESFYAALLDSVQYEGTATEFKAIDTNGKAWDISTSTNVRIEYLGDVK